MASLVSYATSSESQDEDEEQQEAGVDDLMEEVTPTTNAPLQVATNNEALSTSSGAAPVASDDKSTPQVDQAEGVVPIQMPETTEEGNKNHQDQDEGDDDDDDEEDEEEEDLTPEPSFSFSSPPPFETLARPPSQTHFDEDQQETLQTQSRDHSDNKMETSDGPIDGEPEQDSEDPNQSTAAKRIAELDKVQHDIGRLLHIAGGTLASLHPEPIESFTDPKPSLDEVDDRSEGQDDKQRRFEQFAANYYSLLDDVQLSLRTSIRHLRLSRASPQALLDPNYASLLPTTISSTTNESIGAGGIPLAKNLEPLQTNGTLDSNEKGSGSTNQASGSGPSLSIAAMELQAEAWQELARVLEASERNRTTATSA